MAVTANEIGVGLPDPNYHLVSLPDTGGCRGCATLWAELQELHVCVAEMRAELRASRARENPAKPEPETRGARAMSAETVIEHGIVKLTVGRIV